MSSTSPINVVALIEEIKPMYLLADPVHDFSHILRVYSIAKWIGEIEHADMSVLLLAALLHDLESGPKLEEQSAKTIKTKAAEDFLKKKCVPDEISDKIIYAIKVHRFSKGIMPNTLEAMILQDADRLDAIGAIGIARVFMTGGALKRAFYNPDDPFCAAREPDDKIWNLDHFYRKLLKLESGMHTEAAKILARRRAEVLERYLIDIKEEIEGKDLKTIEGVRIQGD